MSENIEQNPSFSEVYLKAFIQRNPHAEISVNENFVIIDKPWEREDARLKADVKNVEFIDALNSLKLSAKFDAIFHADENMVEFIYGYYSPDSNYSVIDREFSLHYCGSSFKCFYAEPTERLFLIAKHFERLPQDSSIDSVPQIGPFRDIQSIEEKSERIKKWFDGKVPRSFFIKGEDLKFEELEGLARQVNFLMSYYDRFTPLIEIKPEPESSEHKVPIRLLEGAFPEALVSQPIDDIVLKLVEVARGSQPRFAFLYYYQVFEYCGYYYVDEAVKRNLKKYLKDPALINCDDEKVSELFTIFVDLNHNDDVKMRKVIEEHCDPCVVWKEIENDLEFFSSEHEYDGGFTSKALVSSDTTVGAWQSSWMPNLFDHLTKIRNSLVHARERRENRVILPTAKNNSILRHYIPLIRRVAEQIALKT